MHGQQNVKILSTLLLQGILWPTANNSFSIKDYIIAMFIPHKYYKVDVTA